MAAFDWNQATQSAASLATAVGVTLAWWQLRHAKRQAMVAFEDALNREYRDLARLLPAEAMLGLPLPSALSSGQHATLLSYIDLSNEQVFLRQQKRVSKVTWQTWSDGIQSNLARPAFREAWLAVKRDSSGFQELRRLEAEAFRVDPATWGRAHLRSNTHPDRGGPA